MPEQRRQRHSVVVPPRRRPSFGPETGLLLAYAAWLAAPPWRCSALGLYGYVKFTGPGPLADDKVFQIERGAGVLGIAAELEKAGIISSANLFAAAADRDRQSAAASSPANISSSRR